jgi:hypothetical protein
MTWEQCLQSYTVEVAALITLPSTPLPPLLWGSIQIHSTSSSPQESLIPEVTKCAILF